MPSPLSAALPGAVSALSAEGEAQQDFRELGQSLTPPEELNADLDVGLSLEADPELENPSPFSSGLGTQEQLTLDAPAIPEGGGVNKLTLTTSEQDLDDAAFLEDTGLSIDDLDPSEFDSISEPGFSLDDLTEDDLNGGVVEVDLASRYDERLANNDPDLTFAEFAAHEEREGKKSVLEKGGEAVSGIKEGFSGMVNDLLVAGFSVAEVGPEEAAASFGEAVLGWGANTGTMWDAATGGLTSIYAGATENERTAQHIRYELKKQELANKQQMSLREGETYLGSAAVALDSALTGRNDGDRAAIIQRKAEFLVNDGLQEGLQFIPDIILPVSIGKGVAQVGIKSATLPGKTAVTWMGGKGVKAAQMVDKTVANAINKATPAIGRALDKTAQASGKAVSKTGKLASLAVGASAGDVATIVGGQLIAPAIGATVKGGLTAGTAALRHSYRGARGVTRFGRKSAAPFAHAIKGKLEYGTGFRTTYAKIAADASQPAWTRTVARQADFLSGFASTRVAAAATAGAVTEALQEGIQESLTIGSTFKDIGRGAGGGAAFGGPMGAVGGIAGARNLDEHFQDLDALDYRDRVIERGDDPAIFDGLDQDTRRGIAAMQGVALDSSNIRLVSQSEFARLTDQDQGIATQDGAFIQDNGDVLVNMNQVGFDNPKRLLSTIGHEIGHAAYLNLDDSVKDQWRDLAHREYGEDVVEKFRQDYGSAIGKEVTTDVALDEMFAEHFLGHGTTGKRLLDKKWKLGAIGVGGQRTLRRIQDGVLKKMGIHGSGVDPNTDLLEFTPYKDNADVEKFINGSLRDLGAPLPKVDMPKVKAGPINVDDPGIDALQRALDAEAGDVITLANDKSVFPVRVNGDNVKYVDMDEATDAVMSEEPTTDPDEQRILEELQKVKQGEPSAFDHLVEEAPAKAFETGDVTDADIQAAIEPGVAFGKEIEDTIKSNIETGGVEAIPFQYQKTPDGPVESKIVFPFKVKANKAGDLTVTGLDSDAFKAYLEREGVPDGFRDKDHLRDVARRMATDPESVTAQEKADLFASNQDFLRSYRFDKVVGLSRKSGKSGVTSSISNEPTRPRPRAFSPARDAERQANIDPGNLSDALGRVAGPKAATDFLADEGSSQSEPGSPEAVKAAAKEVRTIKRLAPKLVPAVRARAKQAATSNQGGAEHEVHLDPASDRVVKVWRHWDGGGDTPRSYIDRHTTLNRFFNSDNRIEGVLPDGGIVTSAPFADAADINNPHPTPDQIREYMWEHGFRGEGDIYRRGKVTIYDTKPENFVQTQDGTVIIDALVVTDDVAPEIQQEQDDLFRDEDEFGDDPFADTLTDDPLFSPNRDATNAIATDQTANVRTGAEGVQGLRDPAQDPQSTGQEGPIQLGNQAEVPLGLQASDGTGSSPDLGAAVQPPLKGVAVEAGDTAAITKFRDGLVATNATHKFGFAVEDKGPDFYANPETRLFTSGGAGVAVTPDGDMVSVFKQPGTEGNVRELIDMAIEAGADRLDNYDIGGFLPGFYAKHGSFKQVARVKFNRELAPEGTPADQSPDISLMVHDPDGVVQADDTLFEDYEDAEAAQMAAVAQVRAAQAQVQETHTPEFEVAPLPVEITNKKKNTAKTIPYALTQSPESTTFQGVVDDPTLPDYKKKFPYKVTGEGQKRINRQIESGYVDELKRRLVNEYNEVVTDPAVAGGQGWYSRMRKALKEVLGDRAEIFAQLLGATSAKTPVDTNFIFTVDAFDRYESGALDETMANYVEARAMTKPQLVKALNDKGITHTTPEDPKTEPKLITEKTQMPTLLVSYDQHVKTILPRQSNGKKYGANSSAVAKVLAGVWLTEATAPKTPNFAGNLTGRTLAATIDVWAARTLRRLTHGSADTPWRIQAKSEGAVSNEDFAFGQIVFERAAAELGINPDDLQAVAWFGEKARYRNEGITGAVGEELSSFDTAFDAIFRDPDNPASASEGQRRIALQKKLKQIQKLRKSHATDTTTADKIKSLRRDIERLVASRPS